MTFELADPRCYAAADTSLLAKLASLLASATDAAQCAGLRDELQDSLKQALLTGRDDLLATALTAVSSPAAGRVLWLALDQAINTPNRPDTRLAARLVCHSSGVRDRGLAWGGGSRNPR